MSTGNLDARDDRAEAAALAALWPGQRPKVTSFDGQVGFAGAAAPALALSLATSMLAPDGTDSLLPRAERVLVSSGDPDGGAAVLLLERPGEPS